MKKIIFISIFFAFVFATQAQNKFKAGIKAGISTSQVEGDTYGGFDKFGFDGGATLNAKLSEKWAAQFEILFVQKGSKHQGDANKGDLSFYLMQLNYVEVPLLLQYKQKKFTFEIGPGIGYLISAKEYDYYSQINNTIPFNSTEVSASIGINYQLYKNLGVNWRFTNSMLPIRAYASGASFWFNPGQRNNVLAFTLTYTFSNAEQQ
ncbi:hypothetical protein BH10BAC1_BH10BAC1_03180 [soil metagenome]